jgi:hypothetical protein
VIWAYINSNFVGLLYDKLLLRTDYTSSNHRDTIIQLDLFHYFNKSMKGGFGDLRCQPSDQPLIPGCTLRGYQLLIAYWGKDTPSAICT